MLRPALDFARPDRRALPWIALSALLLAGVSGAGCAVNPATGRAQIALLSESEEIALGRQNHAQILRTMGALGDPELQAYVQKLGLDLARRSERPRLPWTFTVLDDTAINAFALPGGFIYVTRGILAHMNSEGELVGVLGHEIGHVTARHSVAQISRQQLAQFGLLLGTAVAPELRSAGQLLQTGVGLLLLKYSRDAERQADDLGVRYMSQLGYVPTELAEILGVLDRAGRAQSRSPIPDWLSTHPNPGDRVARVRQAIARGAMPQNPRPSVREPFLARLDGLPWGPNPREGFFEDDAFFHPDLALQLQLPRGWKHRNTKQALQSASPDGQAILSVELAQARDPQGAAREFFSGSGAGTPRAAGTGNEISIGPFRALDVPFTVQPSRGAAIVGNALFVQDGSRVYQMLGYGIASRYDDHRGTIENALGSLDRLRNRCRLEVQPARIQVVQARRSMTLVDLERGSPPDVGGSALALLNHLDPGAALVPGQRYKRVARGSRPCR